MGAIVADVAAAAAAAVFAADGVVAEQSYVVGKRTRIMKSVALFSRVVLPLP